MNTYHAKDTRTVTVPTDVNMWGDAGGVFHRMVINLAALIPGERTFFAGVDGRYPSSLQGASRLIFNVPPPGEWIGNDGGTFEDEGTGGSGAWRIRVVKLDATVSTAPGEIAAQTTRKGAHRLGR